MSDATMMLMVKLKTLRGSSLGGCAEEFFFWKILHANLYLLVLFSIIWEQKYCCPPLPYNQGRHPVVNFNRLARNVNVVLSWQSWHHCFVCSWKCIWIWTMAEGFEISYSRRTSCIISFTSWAV